MKIGTDVSLEVCKTEGYLIIECDPADLVTFDPTKTFTFERWLPDYVPIRSNVNEPYLGHHSATDLWEMYISRFEHIDQFTGDTYTFPDSVYELLTLADAIESCYGEVIPDYGR